MLPFEWHEKLRDYANAKGLVFFSSPFDAKCVDFLESLNVPIYKVASPEITDIPLIEYIASKGKPMIISTGMAELEDIERAVNICKQYNINDLTLLKCTSEYPAPMELANLRTIPDLKLKFNTKVGVSDHTPGSTVPITAIALGAQIIEKHFILDRNLGGIDSAFSMEPLEFKEMVRACKDARKALGNVNYDLNEKTRLRRRSVFVYKDLEEGEVLSIDNIRIVRPGNGVHPKLLSAVLGKKVKSSVKAGTPLSLDLLK